jgi:hypothetical protein
MLSLAAAATSHFLLILRNVSFNHGDGSAGQRQLFISALV